MKKYLLLLLITISIKVTAQPELWGTMQVGGTNGIGAIFHINGDGSNYVQVPNFAGGAPTCNLLPYNGLLYGLSSAGGVDYHGDVFTYDPVTSTYTTVFSFSDITSGKYPRGSLFLASDGKMYGTTSDGGTSDFGTLFRFDPSNNQLTKLKDFTGVNGKWPQENLIEFNGKLYGTTAAGGTYGTIFSYELSSGNVVTVHSFNFTDGMSPYGSLLLWNSLLYGTTFVGGSAGSGTIFSFDPNTPGMVTTHHHFNITNGAAPMGSLIYAGNSLMYGLTAQGGSNGDGTLFNFNPSSNVHTKLHDFDAPNGKDPEGSLIQASDGDLYGTTVTGGTGNSGTLFKYSISTGFFTKIHDCTSLTGSVPSAGFIEYNGPTGLPDLTKNNELKIINNPVNSELTIALKGYTDAFEVEIYSLDGKLIKNWNDVIIADQYSFDVSRLESGNYFIRVVSENHKFTSQFTKK